MTRARIRQAIETECERLSVTTHTDRADARAFYVQIGMQETGRRFGKPLNPEPDTGR